MSLTIERSIEIDAAVPAVYNQWTQFENFPQFLDGVREVRQLDEKRILWRTVIGGRELSWEAAIVEQSPDRCIGWRSSGCPVEAGRVTFTPSGAGTHVALALDLGATDTATERLIAGHVEENLRRFKAYIEARRDPTGAWRGEIHGGQLEHPPTGAQEEAARHRAGE